MDVELTTSYGIVNLTRQGHLINGKPYYYADPETGTKYALEK